MGCLGPTTVINRGLLVLAHQHCPEAYLIFIGSLDGDKKISAIWCHWFLLPPWLPSCIQGIQGASRWTHLLNHYGSKLFLAHPAEKQEALQHFQRESFYSKCWHSCLKFKFSFIFESAYCRKGNCRWTVLWTVQTHSKTHSRKSKSWFLNCKIFFLDQKTHIPYFHSVRPHSPLQLWNPFQFALNSFNTGYPPTATWCSVHPGGSGALKAWQRDVSRGNSSSMVCNVRGASKL